MNQRFRELLKQSTNPPWDGEQGPMNEFNLERFAELIVEECLDILEDEDNGKLDTRSVRIAAIRIKKLFGVED
jgi:hypothetical protein